MKWLLPLILVVLFLFPKPSFAQTLKHVEVDLSKQHLYAYDNQTLVYDFLISSGKMYPTVTGTFYPYAKLTSTRMRGGNRALGTYYDLPGVPYTVYFYQGFALHGTYWHSNFGHPMSHGCVNLATPDAKLLYYWIDYTTPIHIYGTTPAT
jgi:lipoprotein-anchoring transpeptidase ErfK/SrfK